MNAISVLDPLILALLAALLLGLRHATDPDHLTAILTLVVDDVGVAGAGSAEQGGGAGRSALALGGAWGAGHALTLLVFGLPVVVWGNHLPEWAHGAAELAVGLLIVGLAVRLLVRWRRGYFHGHEHDHGDLTHAHPHFHEGEEGHEPPHHHHEEPPEHEHSHADEMARTAWGAFGVGLVHGVGGSAGASLLVTAAVEGSAGRAIALAVFAGGTALSMALLTGLFGRVFAGRLTWRRAAYLFPAVGIASLAFGAWYAWQAWGGMFGGS